MPRIYEQPKAAFCNFDHFKETAVKTLNEIFGRVRPLDVIDFSENADTYRAVGYYDGEALPAEQKPGEPQSEEAAEQERIAREQDEANRRASDKEFEERIAYVRGELDANRPLASEDLAFAVSNGLLPDLAVNATQAQDLTHVSDEEIEAQLNGEQSVPTYTLDTILKATDEAMKLAEEHGVDLSKVVGTGAGGNIKKSDVAEYLKNNAPVKENADEDSDQQQDT